MNQFVTPQPPRSGIVPIAIPSSVIPKSGEVHRAVAPGLTFASGATLAVSLEPKGGSPTGAPTGPVVTTATLLRAG